MNTIKAQSKFSLLREGNLNRFYTRDLIGQLITEQIANITPAKVIDLGAGEGSLSVAVGRHWPDTEIVTVDVDPDCVSDLHTRITDTGVTRHTHHVYDVLHLDLPSALTQHGSFDLAVCNPPFFRPEWNRDFSLTLQRAGLDNACSSTAEVTAEVLFLAQNLRLLNSGGVLALIIPDGILTGWRMATLRHALLIKHRVDCVMQLPAHSFHDTEARCFVLFLTKDAGPTNNIKLLRYENASGLSEPIFIDAVQAEKRMDYDYHAEVGVTGAHIETLRQLGAHVIRGSLSTAEARNADFPVFHTTDYGKAVQGRVTLSPVLSNMPQRRLVVAEAGDILMARVDRSLHQKVAIVTSGQAALTDCVYRVRLPEAVQEAVFAALRSAEGMVKLQAVSKGVSARLLGKADLLDLPLNIPATSLT